MNLGLGNTKVAFLSMAVEGEMASFVLKQQLQVCSLHLVCISHRVVTSSLSLAVQNGNSPVDSIHTGIFGGKAASESI